MSKFKNLIIFIGIILVAIIFLLLPFVVKVKIECVSQYGVCPAEIVTQLNKYNGKSLAVAKRGVKKILKDNILISNFSTQFKLPSMLLVNILIKKPAFVLKNNTNQAVAVGQDGRILSVVGNTTLPTVMIEGSLKKIGEEVDKEHLFVLNLIAGINEMYQVNIGRIEGDSLVVELPTNIKVIFPMDGDTQILLGSLRLVYGKIQSGEQKESYSEIDLRFKNPVLR